MMIELTDRYLRLIRKLEKENSRYYKIAVVNDRYYIDVDTLLDVLDDTEDNRVYAEEKLEEITKDYEERLKDNNPNINDVIWYKEQLTKVKEENENLKEENEILRNQTLFYCNEDMLDRLNIEGVEL